MVIAIDFDGTCVTNEYPGFGQDIGAVPVLKELVRKSHKLILLTNRSDKPLSDAVSWFKAYGIPLFGINHNPVQFRFSNSPKIFADIYIDDAALGCPLITDEKVSLKPYVDWKEVRKILAEQYNIT